VLPRLRGSFSIAVVSADEPDTIVAARRSTPNMGNIRQASGAAGVSSE